MQPKRFPARRRLRLPDGGDPAKGIPLPPDFIRRYQRFFPTVDLKKVRVHIGIPRKLAKLAGIPHPAAVSYRNRIYVDPNYADLRSAEGRRLILHELRHVAQWKAFGDELYTSYQKAHSHGYWRNPYERDAYRYERLVLKAA